MVMCKLQINVSKQVDIMISKNQILQILYLVFIVYKYIMIQYYSFIQKYT